MEIITKEEAIHLKQKWYFTGILCRNGHIEKRYVNTGICYECKRRQNSKDYNVHHEKALIRGRRASKKVSKGKHNADSRNWSKNNREKRKQISKKNKLKYSEKYRAKNREYQRLKRLIPSNRLSMNISKAIWECLKGNKNHIKWSNFVKFTLSQLIDHLQNKFKEGMNWDNYGTYWHLDHIKPLSWFNLDTEFEEAWNINNLQPLEASLNLSKNNRYEG